MIDLKTKGWPIMTLNNRIEHMVGESRSILSLEALLSNRISMLDVTGRSKIRVFVIQL